MREASPEVGVAFCLELARFRSYWTVTTEFPDWPPKVAVTVEVPVATAVTTPAPFTVATLVLLELQFAWLVTLTLELFE